MHALHVGCLLLAQVAPAPELPPNPRLGPLQPMPVTERSILSGQPTPADGPPSEFPPQPQPAAVGVDVPSQPSSFRAPTNTPAAPPAAATPAATPPAASHAADDVEKPGPAALLKYAFQPRDESVAGAEVSLLTAVERAQGNAARLAAVKAYWQLSLALADYHHAVDEVGFLGNLPETQLPHEQAMLRAAVAAARARKAEARLAVAAAQHDLKQAALSVDAEPLPADAPYVGVYRTNFEALFAQQPAPAALVRINRTLPLFKDLVDARATAVTAAGEALMSLTARFQQGQHELAPLVESFLQLRHQRIAFLAAVRDYNYSIADYALGVASPELSSEAVVAMLIATTPDTRSVLVPRDRGVQPVSAEEPIKSVLVPVQPAQRPSTFVPQQPPQPLSPLR